MGKGWAEASPRSTADRHFMLEPGHSLPPVRVCTPPARGEGAMLRGNYTSSSSEVSLDRTPLYHAAAPGPGHPATAAQQLMHWHSAPAEDPGHLRPADSDAQQAQAGHFGCASMHQRTPQHSPHGTLRSEGSAAAACCPLCPDSEARLAAARDAVVDLMQRLTDTTEERDEALAAAQREWRLAELLRQELAATPDHPQAHAASSCGRPSGGLRSSRIPDVDSAERFDTDWQTTKRDLAAAGDAFLTPRSSVASPMRRQQRRPALETASASEGAFEAYFTPMEQLSPARASSSPVQECRGSSDRQRSTVRRQLLMDSCHRRHTAAAAANDAADPRLLHTLHSGSPLAATSTASAFYQTAQREHSAELAAAEARADALEQKLSSAGSFIAQLLLPQGSGSVPAGRAASSQSRRESIADWPATAAAGDEGLLHRLQALATEAADVSRPADGGGSPPRSSSSRPSLQHQQHGRQHGRRSRLGTTSFELPPWSLEPGAAAGSASPAVAGGDGPNTNGSDEAASQLRPGSPLAAMQQAVQQMGAVARRVRAATQNPVGERPTAAAAGSCALALPDRPSNAGRDGCAAPGLGGRATARTALVHARMDMAAAAQALAARSAESQRLASPYGPPMLGC